MRRKGLVINTWGGGIGGKKGIGDRALMVIAMILDVILRLLLSVESLMQAPLHSHDQAFHFLPVSVDLAAPLADGNPVEALLPFRAGLGVSLPVVRFAGQLTVRSSRRPMPCGAGPGMCADRV